MTRFIGWTPTHGMSLGANRRFSIETKAPWRSMAKMVQAGNGMRTTGTPRLRQVSG